MLKRNQIVRAKETFDPLYSRGDKFKIIKINKDPDLMSIEARMLKSGAIYGFEEGELSSTTI